MGAAPFVFDPAVDFEVSFRSLGGPVVIAFQHFLRFRLTAKQKGQMKAAGYSIDDPRAWMLPQRIPLLLHLASARAACYFGPASPTKGLVAPRWARLLQKGPGLNRRQALELFERDLLGDEALMNSLISLEGLKLMCLCSMTQRCHGDILIQVFKKMKGYSRPATFRRRGVGSSSGPEAATTAGQCRTSHAFPSDSHPHCGGWRPGDGGSRRYSPSPG